MQIKTTYHQRTCYPSDLHPDIETENTNLAKVIRWADANPHVWKIVSNNKSKAFGRNSCVYIGWAQGKTSPEAVLERVNHFHELVNCNEPHISPSHFTHWRAQFTFEHYRDKGFTGGFFQQHDEKYPRNCMSLDYTPETLEEIIDRFLKWCGGNYKTQSITVDKKVVRQIGGLENGKCL